MIFKLIGLIISLASLSLVLLLGGTPFMYLDLPSLVLMIGIFFGGAIFGYGNKIFSYIRSSRQQRISSSELFATLDFYNYLTRLTLYAGMLAFILSTVLILAQSNDTTAIGPSIALSLLTCLYSSVISYLIIQPIKQGVLYQNMNPSKPTQVSQDSI